MNESTDQDNAFWDGFSDQPYPLARRHKRRLSTANLLEYVRTGATLAWRAPVVAIRYLTLRPPATRPAPVDFVGLSVSFDPTRLGAIRDMLDDLGVSQLLVRFPTWERERLDDYVEFVANLGRRKVLINVLQNRDSVLNPGQWRSDLARAFAAFTPLTDTFQIGNASNRTKWGCLNLGEYLSLLETAEAVRADFPNVKLAGSSVIDFEPVATLRTLYNRRRYRLDAVGALLYVNRRGSPFSRQYGVFDLARKIRLLRAVAASGNRNAPRLWITEVNWPLLGTRPYTPNSGRAATTVDEATQARYLSDYYRIAYASGVERVYWWQLIAPGYGLVDSRDGLRHRPSYDAFKTLLASGLEGVNQVRGSRCE